VAIIALQDTIIHNPQLPQNYHFHFVKINSGTKEKDYSLFFSIYIYICLSSEKSICLIGISYIINIEIFL